MIVIVMVMVYLFLILPLCVVWSGYVLSELWMWFVVPTFGVPELSIPAATGMALVVSYLTHRSHANGNEKLKDLMFYGALELTLRPALALVFGSIVAQWM